MQVACILQMSILLSLTMTLYWPLTRQVQILLGQIEREIIIIFARRFLYLFVTIIIRLVFLISFSFYYSFSSSLLISNNKQLLHFKNLLFIKNVYLCNCCYYCTKSSRKLHAFHFVFLHPLLLLFILCKISQYD